MSRQVGRALGVLLALAACSESPADRANGTAQAGASGTASGGAGSAGSAHLGGSAGRADGAGASAVSEAGQSGRGGSGTDSAAGGSDLLSGAPGTAGRLDASGGVSGSGAGASGNGGEPSGGAGRGGSASAGGTTSCPGAGHAVEFDGDARTQMDTDATIGSVLPTGNASRTVEMWLYTVPKSWRAEHHLYQFGGTNPREGAFGIDFGDGPYPNVQVYTNGTADTTFQVPQDTVKETGWFHFAMVWDGASNTLRGVINGLTRGKKTINAQLTTTASRLSIGYSPTFSGKGGFTGKIDEFRIWSRARTDAEIKSTMQQRLSGKEPGLVVYFRFDEGTGTSSFDALGGYEAKFGGNVAPKWVISDLLLTCP